MDQAPRIVTADEQLALMRQGYKAELKLKYNKLEVPCRLMAALEEATIIANAKTAVKVPEEGQRPLLESLEVMKAILMAGTFVNSTPYLNRKFLDQLSNTELQSLYDQYLTLCTTVNPEFEVMTPDQIGEMIVQIKKKAITSKELYTWQHAAIGKYFLEKILPAVSGLGT